MAQRFRTLTILWFGLVNANLVLFGMLEYLRVFAQVGTKSPTTPIVPLVLAVAAFMIAGMSFMLPSMMFKKRMKEMGTPVVSDANIILAKAFPAYTTSFIVGAALADAVSLMGFIVGYNGYPRVMYAPFFGLALVMLLVKFPRRAAILRAVEEATGARALVT